MTILIYAEDLSGRNDHGYYAKPSLSSALDIFFDQVTFDLFLDKDGEISLTREEVEAIYQDKKRVVFYNLDGEKFVISDVINI